MKFHTNEDTLKKKEKERREKKKDLLKDCAYTIIYLFITQMEQTSNLFSIEGKKKKVTQGL